MATVTDSTFTENNATYGAGIFNYGGTLTVSNSTFSGNNADYGGGIDTAAGPSTITNATFTGNNSSFGGGIESSGPLTLTDATLNANSATIYGGGINSSGPLTLQDTIVAGNTAQVGGLDIYGSITTDNGYNLLGTAVNNSTNDPSPGPHDVFSNSPLLAALGNSGGPTQTMALAPGSPAIGAGVAIAGISTDQRGLPRPASNPDIGAFQTQPPQAASFVVSAASTATAGVGFTVTITAEDQHGDTVTNYSGPVTLTSSDGQAVLLSPAGINLSNGTATVTVTLDTADTTTLTANAGSITGTSGSITVATEYTLTDGNLYNSAGKLIDTDVQSFALGSQGQLYYLEQDSSLYLYGDSAPLANAVVSFKLDGAGSVVWLGLDGTLRSLAPGATTPSVLDTNVSAFTVDGGGSVVDLNYAGTLSWFAPGSTVRQTVSGVPASVAYFKVDGAGVVFALDQAGDLLRIAAGTGTASIVGTGVESFVVDGAGSVVALEGSYTSSTPPSAPGGISPDIIISETVPSELIRFAPGSDVAQLLDTGVTQFAVDGAGSVVELNASGNLTRFAPGSTTPQLLADNCTSFAVDGSGSVVELQSSSVSDGISPNIIIDGSAPGGVLQSPLFLFAPGSDVPQLLDTGVTQFAVDGAGSVVELNASGNLTRFAPGSTTPQLLADNCTSFAVDGSGSVVELQSSSESAGISPDIIIDGSAPGGVLQSPLFLFAPGSDVPQLGLDHRFGRPR